MVSIHAPVQAGDFPYRQACLTSAGFNPRPRTSGRLQSILICLQFLSFNPRPRTSGRPLLSGAITIVECFNPRPRTSGRLFSIERKRRMVASFNPRPRTSGRPIEIFWTKDYQIVSIHAPVQAGDVTIIERFDPPTVSIHAPVQAGDRSSCCPLQTFCLFQSTPPYKRATYRRVIP